MNVFVKSFLTVTDERVFLLCRHKFTQVRDHMLHGCSSQSQAGRRQVSVTRDLNSRCEMHPVTPLVPFKEQQSVPLRNMRSLC